MLVSVSYFLLINDTMNQREIEYIERIYIKHIMNYFLD